MQCLAGEGTAWTAEPFPRRAGARDLGSAARRPLSMLWPRGSQLDWGMSLPRSGKGAASSHRHFRAGRLHLAADEKGKREPPQFQFQLLPGREKHLALL